MKIPYINLTPVQFKNDAEATRDFAIFTARLVDIIRDLYQNSQTIPVVGTAPVVTQLQEVSDAKGEVRSDVKILDDSTQTNRKLYYRYQGNLRIIDSA